MLCKRTVKVQMIIALAGCFVVLQVVIAAAGEATAQLDQAALAEHIVLISAIFVTIITIITCILLLISGTV